jgi:error-prone DNA polymerase
MGWDNPVVPWSELERVLSGRPRDPSYPGDGGDSPAWTRRREEYVPPEFDSASDGERVPYAELHCHSNFSFLDGASHPEELVEQAVRLGLDAVALTDHDGMYGVVRLAEAAKGLGMRTVYGAELNLGLTRTPTGVRTGTPDPVGSHLLVLARDADGYRRLCRVITNAQIAGGEKGRPSYDLGEAASIAGGHWLVFTGCRKGSVRQALAAGGPDAAERELRRLVELFGADHVAVELIDHGLPTDSEDNDALAGVAQRVRLPTVATNAVHYATPKQRRLATVLAAVRARSSLDDMDGWLPPAATAHLRSGAEMAARFTRYPGAVARAAAYGLECAFDLRLVAPDLPPFEVQDPYNPASWLRELARAGAIRRYGSYDEVPHAFHQIDKELRIIEGKNFPGYFLIVHDIVQFCERADILCQGRGSAANSAVCYALGITNVDAVANNLLFERFLAPDRDGYPDIDLDIESDRREEVIQYVYEKYGRECAAQVANVITYRAKSAVRDVARALGHSPGTQDAWSKQIDRWGPLDRADLDDIPESVVDLAEELTGFPRHLGIHSGGMVLCDRPVGDVCPVEWARMDRRSVLQWDKDDCAAVGLVKFDLLGLGMLAALHYTIDLIAEWHGRKIELSDLQPFDPLIYEMLCRGDSVGVFQVESRAQIATLPRLKPRKFYDLVVEVALIRPGPIQGGSVHPYIRRRNGLEEWKHDHDLLKPALEKTYGVPLFQEQLMQIAVDVAGFSAAEADQLRRAMGAKRSEERMNKLRGRFFAGMAKNDVPDDVAERIFEKLLAFANFGFPESHSISFASLVYSSAWFKYYYPAAFCAALLRAQPMGFYSPQSLIADARRHGVVAYGPDINASLVHARLEPLAPVPSGSVSPEGSGSVVPSGASPGGSGSAVPPGGASRVRRPPAIGPPPQGSPPELSTAVRLGLGDVRLIGKKLAERIVAERKANGPYAGMVDVARRVGLTVAQAEALATAGAFGADRRQALWAAGAAAQERPDRLPGLAAGVQAPELPGMTELERAAADVWATGVSPDTYPTQFLRDHLDRLGVLTAAQLMEARDRDRVLVAGAVTHRQRPATAGGVTFLNLEDETGMVNVVCSPRLWVRYRRVARASPALLVYGRVERTDGVVALVAERLEHLDLRIASRSRDFR